MKNKRHEHATNVGKELVGNECTSFAKGVKWADFHPNWIDAQSNKPKKEYLENGLPKLYFCQILTLDMTFGYRYSYRVGFINDSGNWNIETSNTCITKYMEIYCDESTENLLKDIRTYFNKNINDNI